MQPAVRTEDGARYPLLENEAQARIMAFMHEARRPVPRVEMTEKLGFNRRRISMEAARLVEHGLLG